MGSTRKIAERLAGVTRGSGGEDYFTPEQRRRVDEEVVRIRDMVAAEINRVAPEVRAMDPDGLAYVAQGILEELIDELQRRV